MYKNILIIQTAFIGDAILASSLIEKLHHTLPAATISILVRKGNETIYQRHPFLREVLVWTKSENKFANLLSLLKQIRRNKYDCVINCHRYASSGFLTAFSGAKHTTGYKENPFSAFFNFNVKHSIGDGRHETKRYNELIEDFTDNIVFKPKLYPTDSDFDSVKKYKSEKYFCLAPASVWFTKQLPVDKWIELCNLLDQSCSIYLIGGPGDVLLFEEIKSKSQHPAIKNLAGRLSLLQSAALIKDAEMNYVNDSAPLHLASSVDAAVTAFFCSTIPEFGFGPLSSNTTIIEVKNLPCRPCGLHGRKACPLGHFKCGNLITLPLS